MKRFLAGFVTLLMVLNLMTGIITVNAGTGSKSPYDEPIKGNDYTDIGAFAKRNDTSAISAQSYAESDSVFLGHLNVSPEWNKAAWAMYTGYDFGTDGAAKLKIKYKTVHTHNTTIPSFAVYPILNSDYIVDRDADAWGNGGGDYIRADYVKLKKDEQSNIELGAATKEVIDLPDSNNTIATAEITLNRNNWKNAIGFIIIRSGANDSQIYSYEFDDGSIEPYDTVNFSGDMVYESAGVTFQNNGLMGSADNGDYVYFKNCKFGSEKARAFSLKYALDSAISKTVNVFLGDKEGEPEFSFEINGTGGWNPENVEEHTFLLTPQQAELFTGTKNIYFVFTAGGSGSFESFKFLKEYESAEVNIDNAAGTYSISATVQIHKEGTSTDSRLSVIGSAIGIAEGKPLKELAYLTDAESFNGYKREFAKNDIVWGDTSYASAVLMDSEFNYYQHSTTGVMPVGTVTATTDLPKVAVKNGKLSISGKVTDTATVVLAVKPVGSINIDSDDFYTNENYYKNIDYSQYKFLIPITVTNGSYSVDINPAEIMTTGDYIIDISTDKNVKCSSSFYFMSKGDEDEILSSLKTPEGQPLGDGNLVKAALANDALVDVIDLTYIDESEKADNAYAYLAEQTYSSIDDVIKYVEIADLLVKIADNHQDSQSLLEANADTLGVYGDIFWNKYNDGITNKSDVIKRISEYAGAEDAGFGTDVFAAWFKEAVVTEAISATATEVDVDTVLTTFKNYLFNDNDSFADYESGLKALQRKKIREAMMGYDATSKLQIVSKFEEEYINYKDYEPTIDGTSLNQELLFVNCSEKTDTLRSEKSSSLGITYITGTSTNAYVKFDKIDFSDDCARGLEINYAAPTDGVIDIYIDAVDETPEATIAIAGTGGWTTFQTRTVALTVAEAEKFVGKHSSLYFVFKASGAGNFYSFKFINEVKDYNIAEITGNSSSGYTMSATANAHLRDNVNLSLVGSGIDNNGKIVVGESVSTTEFSSGNKTLNLSNKLVGATKVYSVLMDDSFNYYGHTSVDGDINKIVEPDITKPATPPSIKNDNGKITISGKIDVIDKENNPNPTIIIGIRVEPTIVSLSVENYENVDYTQYKMLVPVETKSGEYMIEVDPSAVGIVTQNKIAVDTCTDSNIKGHSSFYYLSDSDENEIVSALNSAADASAAYSALSSPKIDNIVMRPSDTDYSTVGTPANIAYQYLSEQSYGVLSDIMCRAEIGRLLVGLRNNDSAGQDLLENNADVLNITPTQYWSKYNETTTQKNNVITRMNSYTAANEGSALAVVDDNSILTCFKSAVTTESIAVSASWGKVDETINIFNDYLQIDNTMFTTYNSLNEGAKQLICGELQGKSYTGRTELVNAFEVAFNEHKDYVPSGDVVVTPPSGGGGGGAGAGKVEQPPVEKPDEPIQTVKPVEAKKEFTDLSGYDWAKEQIKYLADKKIVNGRAADKFEPGANITREEFAKIIVLILGISSDDKSVFKDVPNDAWYRPYVMAGYNHGIMNGSGNGLFSTGKAITREEAATMIHRAVKKGYGNLKFVNNTKAFIDSESISGYAKEAISDLSRAGIMNGNDDNYVTPKASITRAETACLIYNYMMQF